jgi:hypothetical protein
MMATETLHIFQIEESNLYRIAISRNLRWLDCRYFFEKPLSTMPFELKLDVVGMI